MRSDISQLFYDLKKGIVSEGGWHPEEALCILEDYINGERVSEDEAQSALASLSSYYYGMLDRLTEQGIDAY